MSRNVKDRLKRAGGEVCKEAAGRSKGGLSIWGREVEREKSPLTRRLNPPVGLMEREASGRRGMFNERGQVVKQRERQKKSLGPFRRFQPGSPAETVK